MSNKAVKIEIGFVGNRLMLDLPIHDYTELTKKLKDQKSPWVTVELNDGASVEIKAQDVQFIKVLPKQVRELKKRSGYNLKDICSVTGENYDVYRQKIKKDGVQLDYGSYKRILLTPRTIKSLDLTKEQVKKIESKFSNKR
ncbi:hypothetical protein [Pseudobdellovibrio exovorus]|uniref:Uncharacterized protein n=1 Tax=Pseudobdellovibrio exovorus JSS TaxID=1184267 RepID=M4V846_9BACT|nr:hypothetical protein [Pseudobdellovibrio exovorus]AGH95388.1 hypothetical protein A11Q_1172 [Pseudobdellovibrio exovorus JSS]